MSLDANYLLVYENLHYIEPLPQALDMRYLKDKYGGHFSFVQPTTMYWEKPKYTLLPEDIASLAADQVLERRDCELWKIIK